MTMKTLAALDAAHAAAREKLAAELDTAARAVVPPHRAQKTAGGLPTWLHYKAPTLADALAIMAAAPVVPAYAYKSTFTRIQPESLADDKSGEAVAGPFAASLDVSQGEGFGPGAKLRFFVMAGEELCEAHVSIEGPGYGPPCHWQWGATFTRDSRGMSKRLDGNGDRYVRGTYFPNTALAAMSDHRIKWHGGDAGAHFQYFWQADTVDGGADHASEQLRTIAEAR